MDHLLCRCAALHVFNIHFIVSEHVGAHGMMHESAAESFKFKDIVQFVIFLVIYTLLSSLCQRPMGSLTHDQNVLQPTV